MDRHVANDKSQVQVIARAAAILRALEDENSGLSLGQIAQRVNLARSTVQRIVAALETEKLVIAATPNGRVVTAGGLAAALMASVFVAGAEAGWATAGAAVSASMQQSQPMLENGTQLNS